MSQVGSQVPSPCPVTIQREAKSNNSFERVSIPQSLRSNKVQQGLSALLAVYFFFQIMVSSISNSIHFVHFLPWEVKLNTCVFCLKVKNYISYYFITFVVIQKCSEEAFHYFIVLISIYFSTRIW